MDPLRRRLFAALLALLTAASALIPALAVDGGNGADEPAFLLGDVDGNGKVSSADARIALRSAARVAELADEQKKAADYDKNGLITSSDARYILRAAAKLDPFAPPTTTAAPTTTVPVPTTRAYTGTVRWDYNILDDSNIELLGDPEIITVDPELWYLTLVNNRYAVASDYKVNLAPAIPGSWCQLDYRVAEAYTRMYRAAANDGIWLEPYSGYRSYQHQKDNYERKTRLYLSYGYNLATAKAKAAMIIMPPGCSEHNLGFAMDIIGTNNNFYQTKAYKWLTEHAADYGFILRYPREKQHITKVEYEPWHWRYVGVEHAKKIKEWGFCLEEYLYVIGMKNEIR
ncbi:MAG: D-alanyl-D-alanine carboxypeptidase family protein [Clostridia bacterium]|nr:D-alanyl-D-alanine carboxypeptidase family protein [Clostridia bacterium]